MRTFTLPTLLLALATSTSVLTAQSGQRGATRGPERGADRARGADVRGDRTPMNAAALLLRQRERLSLTDAQVAQLTALSTEQQQVARSRSPGDALRLRADLRDAMAENGDPAAARAALDKLSAERNARIVAGMQARKDALALLTDDQRTTVSKQRAAAGRRVKANRAQRAGRATTARGTPARGIRRDAPPRNDQRPRGR